MNRFRSFSSDEIDADDSVEFYMLLTKQEDIKARLYNFCEESNMIEGIYDTEQDNDHMKRMETFLSYDKLSIDKLQTFNTAGQLRVGAGMNVMIGNHEPKPGGMHIMYELDSVIAKANADVDPYEVHHEFEALHPFLDGNGRTGRAVWLWQMFNQRFYNIQNKFLQEWYYQSLDRGRV